MHFKNYNLIILSSLGALLLCIVWFGLSLEPLDGDLTRIGNFKESDYGYNVPQEIFEGNLSVYGELADYTKYYDVAVLGDSFADQRSRQFAWQNYLIRKTGLSLITLWHHGETIDAFLRSEGFTRNPPRFVIFESAERGLSGLLTRSGYTGECREQPKLVKAPLPIREAPVKTSTYARNSRRLLETVSSGIHIKDFEYALLYVSLGLKKFFGSGTSADELPLSRHDLFSNTKSDHILVLKDDYKKYNLGPSEMKNISCGLLNLQHHVEKNKQTELIIMIAPDKTSAYAEFILDDRRHYAGIIPHIPAISHIPLPRIDLAISNAIRQGVQDVYLPNDTHWGAHGNEIAASQLFEYLIGDGKLVL